MALLTGQATAVTATDVFLKALGIVLDDYPAWNPTRAADRTGCERIALAIDVNDQLFTPTIENPGTLGLEQIAAWRIAALRRAAEGRAPNSAKPPTFAFSNLASQGVELFVPNLFAGLTATLGLGVRAGPAPGWTLCLTFDHRVTDGFYAARFLAQVAELIRDPGALIDA